MADADKKRFNRLARECAAAAVVERGRNHNRNIGAAALLHVVDVIARGFGVERIESGLNQKQINAAIYQSFNLFGVGIGHCVEVGGTVFRMVDVGRQ